MTLFWVTHAMPHWTNFGVYTWSLGKKHTTCDTLFARKKSNCPGWNNIMLFSFSVNRHLTSCIHLKNTCKSSDQKNPWTVWFPKNLVTILRNSDYTSLVYVLGHKFPCFRWHDPSPNHGTTFQVDTPVLWINSSYYVFIDALIVAA